jgi:hypothetical protein
VSPLRPSSVVVVGAVSGEVSHLLAVEAGSRGGVWHVLVGSLAGFGFLCYARTLCGATKCPERRELGDLLFYEQWVSN